VDDLHRRVERGYDAIADRYDLVIRANRGPETYFRSFLDGILARIPPNGRVLDMGCGAGSITYELARRARVVGLDRSAVQLALARDAAPNALLMRADMAEVQFTHGSFDAIVAFWTLIHVRRDRHRSVFAHIHDWLKPGGFLAGTLGTSDSPEDVDDDFFGSPMYWSHFDAETTRRMLQDAGFELEQAETIADEGEQALWVIATVGPLPRENTGHR
jgi:cyclopropane fatty-acyl-phospholipid synthase-like methyltransferase